jgi:hypothetical protein
LDNTELIFSVHNHEVQVGDVVIYNNQKYTVKHIKYANYVMMLTLALHTNENKIKMNVGVVQENNPKTDYALPTKIIKTLNIGTKKYIGLFTKPPYGSYHLYRQPVGATVKEYAGVVQPNMVIGSTATDFYNRPTGVIDTQHDLWIFLPFGQSLSSKTEVDIGLGYNHLAIFNSTLSHYELISFETATLVDSNTNKYQLSRIKRGLNGSASAMGSPIVAGAEIILFDKALIEINAQDVYSVV